jgi:hypothetical protein
MTEPYTRASELSHFAFWHCVPALLETLRDIQPLRGARNGRRNHPSVVRCRGCGCGCGFRSRCSNSLAPEQVSVISFTQHWAGRGWH